MQKAAENVDKYIEQFEPEIRELLGQMRKTICAAAPNAEETISYAIPSYKLDGMLVHFAAFTKHIGFYPGAGGIAAFADELAGYKTSKGTVQFPFGEPLPLELVTRIVKFRVEQNLEKKKK
ncbi:MAG TPA: DUF1801 domain-containing protein [Pyrinomonadaceae bacterium]|nr:DUF1801 domain-containing protein [Acidobacteriota bacterium]HQZ97617.1 DUF1801 domain-containing protein [Pyrinomonadaceae bacterium]